MKKSLLKSLKITLAFYILYPQSCGYLHRLQDLIREMLK